MHMNCALSLLHLTDNNSLAALRQPLEIVEQTLSLYFRQDFDVVVDQECSCPTKRRSQKITLFNVFELDDAGLPQQPRRFVKKCIARDVGFRKLGNISWICFALPC